MFRREFLSVGVTGTIFCSGCVEVPQLESSESVTARLEIIPISIENNSNWQMRVIVKNTNNTEVSISDIVVVAFNRSGEKICDARVGDLLVNGDPDKEVSMECTDFPAIITAKAEESPCDGVKITLLVWQGSEEEMDDSDDPNLWLQTTRACEGGLPPKKYVKTRVASD